jgi:hypothetical protein
MKRITLVGLLAALAPTAIFAQEGMRYTAFDVSLIDVELDSIVDVDGDGFEVSGSYELNDKLFLLGKWQDQDLDFGIDGRSLEFGAGIHFPLSDDDLDFVATLSYVDYEVDLGNVSGDDDALALGGGIRTRIGRQFEIDALLRYIDFDEAGSDTGVLVGGRWYFADNMAISFGTELNDNSDALRVGFRAEF